MTIEELEIVIKANITDAMSGIKKITDEVKSAVSKSVEPMKDLTNQAKQMANESASSVSQMKSQMQSYASGIGSTAKQQEYLISKIKDLQDLLDKADMGFEVGDTLKIEAQIESLQNKLAKLQEKETKVKVDVDTEDTKPELNSLGDYVKSFFSGLVSGSKQAGKLAGKGLVALFKGGVKGFSNITKNLVTNLKNVASKSKDVGSKIASSFNSGVNSIKKFALGLLSIRTAISLVSKAAQSYLSYDTQLSDSIQNSWNVLGSLLAPILEYAASLFAKAVSYVNAFVQALTGINLVARANAKAINSQAGATKKLNEAQSSLDEFHTVNTDNGGSGSGANKPITVDNIDLKSIKDKILNADWYSVGVSIGEKINSVLEKINWGFIQKMAVALASDLGNFLNGLVDGIDWNLIGTTIGNGIQTALLFAYTFMTTFNWQNFGTAIATSLNGVMNTVDFTLLGQTLASKWVALIDWLYGFVTTFDWAKFGTSIADAVMGWFNSIDWSKAGETLSTGIRGLLTSTKEFIANIDWQQLGNDVWNFIASIDWAGIIEDLAYILGEAIAGIGQFIWGFIEDAVTNIADFWHQKFEEAGGNIIEGLFNGIDEIISNIRSWINEHIFQPFINGFKRMFGINSPSTVMAEQGTYIIQGLFNGISSLVENVIGIFTNIKDKITNKMSEIKNNIGSKLNDIKSNWSNKWDSVKSKVSDVWDKIKDNVSNKIGSMKNKVRDKTQQVADVVKDKLNLSSKATTWARDMMDSFSNGMSSKLNKIKNGAKNIADSIKSFLHFSRPDVGPLRDYETWMPDMVSGLSKTLAESKPKLLEVTDSLANDISESLNNSYSTPIYASTPSLISNINSNTSPDVISPKDMMKETLREAIEETNMNNQSQKVEVEVIGKTEIDGDKLVVAYDKAKNNKGYDGKKNPSFVY